MSQVDEWNLPSEGVDVNRVDRCYRYAIIYRDWQTSWTCDRLPHVQYTRSNTLNLLPSLRSGVYIKYILLWSVTRGHVMAQPIIHQLSVISNIDGLIC